MNRVQVLLCAAILAAASAGALPEEDRPAGTRGEAARQLAFGVKMALKGSWREAAFRFEKSIKVDPNNAFAFNNLGVALESIGEFNRALEAYERAQALEPKNEKIRENKDRLKAYLASRADRPSAPAPAPAAPPPIQGGGNGP